MAEAPPPSSKTTLRETWEKSIHSIHSPIVAALQVVAGVSARNPKRTISSVLALSLLILVGGLATNFVVEVDGDLLWTPKNSKPILHQDWIEGESGFPQLPRRFLLFFHNEDKVSSGSSKNVLNQDTLTRVFQALDALRGVPGYDSVCAAHTQTETCPIYGVVDFFDESTETMQAAIQSDADVIAALSAEAYPDGRPVRRSDIMGNWIASSDNTLISAESLTVRVDLPDTKEAEDFETEALDVILDLADVWRAQDDSTNANHLRLQVQAERSFDDEFGRAIVKDIPLVPGVFIIMSIFTCFIFGKCDAVKSRSLLGFAAVVSVMLSLMTGYGFMFLCGVPLTSMTQILPFIIFGIGLDDAFVLNGAYERTDKTKSAVDRVTDTIDDVGMSITLTTLTSTMAFGLGCISSVPAVFWLCLYAFFTIFVVYLYQVTFFLAATVLDEKRVEDNRRDCCTCFTVTKSGNDDEAVQEGADETAGPSQPAFLDRFMGSYAEQLLKPHVKALVLASAVGLVVACSVSTTSLIQDFDFKDVLPDESYLKDFVIMYDEHTAQSMMTPFVYFRNVEQSDPEVHIQMEQYVQDLVTIPAIQEGPQFFWLRDFHVFVAENNDNVATLTFNEQVARFLQDPVYKELYQEHIVIDETTGNVVESRCKINMDNVDFESVTNMIDNLYDQRRIAESQPVNQGQADWRFFMYEQNFNIWEFFARSTRELTLTTIMGVAAVSMVALLLVPHFSGVLFIFPMITVLYIDLLGFLQWCGVAINPVSYVTLVMSIGLLVDFIMHVLLRYYESTEATRHGKTVDTLSTMGTSVLIGAVSTLLGTLPLAFSSSAIFSTVFIAFVGLILLGAYHGLVVLPVLLSIFGPENDHDDAEEVDIVKESAPTKQIVQYDGEDDDLDC